MTRRAILIAGCGDVGTALGVRLAEAGHRVWGLRRHADRLPASITPVAADLAEPASLGRVPSGVDTLVYAAAADAFDERSYRRAYVDGLRNVLAALEARGARLDRVLFASSTAVYGQTNGEWVDEESPTEPSGFSGRVMLEGEATARCAGCPAALVRLGGIYGPGRGRLVEEVRAGRATVPADGPEWTNRIHRDDAAAALAHLVALPAIDGPWVAVDEEPADRAEVLRWIAARLGAPPPAVRAAPAVPPARPRTNKRCCSAKLVASGFRFRYPTWRDGYALLLASSKPVQ